MKSVTRYENQRNQEEADQILRNLRNHPAVARMEEYIQHGHVTTFRHCESVTRFSRRLNRLFHLHADETALVRGGMLHDFYLYDWHEKDAGHRLHGFRHPERAAANAARYFPITEKERRIIQCHMWPLTITKIPTSREAWLICIADKCCALAETVSRWK